MDRGVSPLVVEALVSALLRIATAEHRARGMATSIKTVLTGRCESNGVAAKSTRHTAEALCDG